MVEDSITFENVWGATVGYGDNRLTVIRENEADEGTPFPTKDWDVTIILTPKGRTLQPGWYMDRDELENPYDSYAGTATDIAYYTQEELDSGIVPDEYAIRVQVVPYPES